MTGDPRKGLLQGLKPAAPVWVQLTLAALLWTGIGTFLLSRGLGVMLKLDLPAEIAIGAIGASLGILKGLKVMRPAAERGATRIRERGDGRCAMGFISWKSWLFVIGMSVFGYYLRRSDLPPWLMGIILSGVGLALIIGSATYWTALFSLTRNGSTPETPPK